MVEIYGEKHSVDVRKLSIVCDILNIHAGVHENDASSAYLVTRGGNILPPSVGLRYLARLRPDLALYGRTLEETALVDKWLATTEARYIVQLKLCKDSGESGEKQKSNKIVSTIAKHMKEVMEPLLSHQTYLVGERLTIADIDLALTVQAAMSLECFESQKITTELPNLNRWLSTILAHPAAMCNGQGKQRPVTGRKMHQTEKSTPGPAIQSGTAKAQEAEDIDAVPPKKVNPLDALPVSPFNLDAWKRKYSNSKDLKNDAMPYFWTNYDPAGWSLYYVRYDKLEGENTLGFTTANMLNGFLQRLEPSFRQYSFAVMNVVGATGHFEIQGVWLIRGDKIPAELEEHPSFEYYIFKKLTHDDPQDKKMIEEYWANDDVVEGHPIDSCKVWK